MTNSKKYHYLPSSSSGTCVLCASPFSASAVTYKLKHIHFILHWIKLKYIYLNNLLGKYWYVLPKKKNQLNVLKAYSFVENKSTLLSFCSSNLASVKIETILSNLSCHINEFVMSVNMKTNTWWFWIISIYIYITL